MTKQEILDKIVSYYLDRSTFPDTAANQLVEELGDNLTPELHNQAYKIARTIGELQTD
jgi:hypothetical protein